MRNLACLVLRHHWGKVMYPDADSSHGFFLRCRRCGKERQAPGGSAGDLARFWQRPSP